MAGWLKVGVYRGQYNKAHYKVNINNIDNSEQMKPMLDDASAVNKQ